MATHHLHLPHVHVPYPHVGQPQDEAHLEGTKPSRLGGIALGAGAIFALGAWLTSLVVLLNLGPVSPGISTGEVAAWTAVAIAAAISLFVMGIWKANRA